ncbi:LuxR C-terminal-related transcriptional regulator [Nonomuraea sp. NPDC001684]
MPRLVTTGVEATQIAAEVFLGAGTVRNDLAAIVAKVNVLNRADVARLAIGSGWI